MAARRSRSTPSYWRGRGERALDRGAVHADGGQPADPASQRALATSSASGGSHESRWQWVSTMAWLRATGHWLRPRSSGRAGRARRPWRPPGRARSCAQPKSVSSWPSAASSFSAVPGMNGCSSTDTTRRPSASGVEDAVEVGRAGLVLGELPRLLVLHVAVERAHPLPDLLERRASARRASRRSRTASVEPVERRRRAPAAGSASGTTPSR